MFVPMKIIRKDYDPWVFAIILLHNYVLCESATTPNPEHPSVDWLLIAIAIYD